MTLDDYLYPDPYHETDLDGGKNAEGPYGSGSTTCNAEYLLCPCFSDIILLSSQQII